MGDLLSAPVHCLQRIGKRRVHALRKRPLHVPQITEFRDGHGLQDRPGPTAARSGCLPAGDSRKDPGNPGLFVLYPTVLFRGGLFLPGRFPGQQNAPARIRIPGPSSLRGRSRYIYVSSPAAADPAAALPPPDPFPPFLDAPQGGPVVFAGRGLGRRLLRSPKNGGKGRRHPAGGCPPGRLEAPFPLCPGRRPQHGPENSHGGQTAPYGRVPAGASLYRAEPGKLRSRRRTGKLYGRRTCLLRVPSL